MRKFLALCVPMAVLAITGCDGGGGDGDPNLQVYVHPAGTISGGATWAKGDHVLEGSITVEGGILTVAACSVIEMPNGGTISVRDGGALQLLGSASCPITVTSSNSVPQAGDWSYIEFYASGDNGANIIQHAVIEYGGDGGWGSVYVYDGASVSMSNSVVQHSSDLGIEVENGGHLNGFIDNEITNNAAGPILVGANGVEDLGAGTYSPNTVDAILVRGEYVDHDTTWLALDAPYLVLGSINVETTGTSARLTIAAGTTIQMSPEVVVDVRDGGGLTLAGTLAAPVTVTSSNTVPQAGDWDGIWFRGNSIGAYNTFDYAIVQYGGRHWSSVYVYGGAELNMQNSTVQHCDKYGVEVVEGGSLPGFFNNTLTDNSSGGILLDANTVDDLDSGVYGPNGAEGIHIRGGTVDHDATWFNLGVPYVASNGFGVYNYDVGASAVLTVEAGTTVELGTANIDVNTNGALRLEGTSTDHVTVTSSSAYPIAGSWNEIDIDATSQGGANYFSYADIEYGGGDGYGQLWLDDGAAITFDNVTFSNAGPTSSCDVATGPLSVILTSGTNTYTLCP